MELNWLKYCVVCLFLLIGISFSTVSAQEVDTDSIVPQARARREGKVVANETDSLMKAMADSVAHDGAVVVDSAMRVVAKAAEATLRSDSARHSFSIPSDTLITLDALKGKENFIPNPKKALWLAMVFPGGGQIYNRKYWKLPLVYGGFLGCVYAMNWNNTMYRDYSQAYIDIMDSDENTKSYENFIRPGYDIQSNMSRLQELFKRKKNFYRRYRDLSMFCMIGVYALSIVDAYVDAELSSFDISHDLSMKVQPTIINDRFSAMRASGMSSNSYGLQCSLSF